MKQKIKEWLKEQPIYQNLRQILLVWTVISAFLVSACIGRSEDLTGHIIFLIVTVAGGIVSLAGWTVVCKKKIRYLLTGNRKKRARKRKWKKGWYFLLFYTIVVRLPQFGDIPRFDGMAYYKMLAEACQNYDFTITGFLNGFRMASHPTQGYMGLLAIGKFLDPTGYTGIMLVNLALVCITSYCVFQIFRRVMKGVSWKYVTVAAVVITSVPSYLGTFSYLNPDTGFIYFFFMAVYSMLYSRYILMIFSILLLALTKEIGMVMAAAFLTGMGLYLIWNRRQEVIHGLTKRRLFYAGFAGILLLLGAVAAIYVVLGGNLWSYEREEIAYFGTIGVHWEFILFKWKEYFLLNFNWLAVLLIIAAGIYLRVRGSHISLRIREKAVLCGTVLSYAAVAAFYCLYVNFAHPRYTIILDVILWAFAVGMTGKVAAELTQRGSRKDLWFRRSAVICCMLLLTQSYMTIDPISNRVFSHESTGEGQIQILDVYSDFIGWTGGGDSTIYNNQYSFFAKAYECVLRDVGYDESMDVIMFDGIGEFDDPYWDKYRKKRTFQESKGTMEIQCIVGADLEKTEGKKEEAVLIHVPAFGGDKDWELEYVGRFYDLVYNGEVRIPGGGIVEYWKCNLKEIT